MSCLGVHFALTPEQSTALWAAYERSDDDGVMAVVEAIEEPWDTAHLQETDKAWDAIHRVLADGTLTPGAGAWPLSGAILGGECLYFRDDYIVRFLDADDVKAVATALAGVSEEWFAARFARLLESGYDGPVDASALEYTWSWFQQLREFFERTASEGREVLFTADQ